MRRLFLFHFLLLCFALPGAARADEDSLGEKIKQIFATPTPTLHRRHKQTMKKKTPTPSPTPTSSPEAKAKKKQSSSPTPAEEETTPAPKRKKKSPTPTPTETPTPTPSETPTPTPSETPSPTPTPAPDESPSSSPAASPSPEKESSVATLSPNEIKGYDENPPEIRKLLETGLALTNRDLKYAYGSADPESGGMDCSGFIYYVLRENGLKDVPRDASGQYVWVRKSGNFRSVLSRDLESFELDELKSGDLLFWTGTYDVEKDPPVTHTMIYLGKSKETGKPVMLGASDGRSFEGKRMFGVSVFDFKTSGAKEANSSGRHPRFVGYGRIPGLGAGGH